MAYGHVQIVQFGALRSPHGTLRAGDAIHSLGLHKGAVCKTVGFSEGHSEDLRRGSAVNLAVYENQGGGAAPRPRRACGPGGRPGAGRPTTCDRLADQTFAIFISHHIFISGWALPDFLSSVSGGVVVAVTVRVIADRAFRGGIWTLP